MDDESASKQEPAQSRPARAEGHPFLDPSSANPCPSRDVHASNGQPNHEPADSAATAFGQDLAAAVCEQCEDRLSTIHWFRTDWQRGGALTGYARFTSDDGQVRPVVVKLPVPPCERLWLVRLQSAQDARSCHGRSTQVDVVPRIYAHGRTLGGYDLAWVVMERLPHGPLGQAWDGAALDLLIETMGRFYQRASHYAMDGLGLNRNWQEVLKRSRDQVRHGGVPQAQCWKQALKKADRRLDKWLSRWHDRPRLDLVHGDFHPANAMTRTRPPHGPALLFDLAAVRCGHWVEDAVYLEHLYWAAPRSLHNRRIGSLLAKARKSHGLPVDADWPELARIKRALLAISAPAMAHHEVSPAHLQAALGVLQREVG